MINYIFESIPSTMGRSLFGTEGTIQDLQVTIKCGVLAYVDDREIGSNPLAPDSISLAGLTQGASYLALYHLQDC